MAVPRVIPMSDEESPVLEAAKAAVRALATIAAAPFLISYAIRSRLLGADRALEGSSQALALLPGFTGQYIRRAFLARVLAECHHAATVEFGVLFSQAGARIGPRAYVGPRCHLGLALIEADVMLAAGVHVPSGAKTHGTADLDRPMRDQPGARTPVRIGAGAWVGSSAVVLADVGRDAIIAAGAVVTSPIPDRAIAAGVPARVIRMRDGSSPSVVLAALDTSALRASAGDSATADAATVGVATAGAATASVSTAGAVTADAPTTGAATDGVTAAEGTHAGRASADQTAGSPSANPSGSQTSVGRTSAGETRRA